MDCGEARRLIGQLAVGATLREEGSSLARHAHACAGCRRFVDRVARARAWLVDGIRPPVDVRPRRLERRARRALADALAARLARDLVTLAERGDPRPLADRRDDLRRVAVLIGARALRRLPWRAALPVLLEQRAGLDKVELVGLAHALDPCGVDILLVHLAQLEGRGRGDVAHAEVERLLTLI